MFSSALGIAESENETTWRWFLDLLRDALHINNDGDGIVALSDREKGIENVLNEILPRASHGFCVFHSMKNVKQKFHTALDGLLFKAAKAANIQDYNEALTRINNLHSAAGKYIEDPNPEKWARALFPARRFGHITSNIAESMNKWLGEARYLDPVGLFRAFVWKLNNLFEKRRVLYAAMDENSLPKRVGKMIEDGIEDGEKLSITRHTQLLFEVQRKTKPNLIRVVDLDKRTCSCGFIRRTESLVDTCARP